MTQNSPDAIVRRALEQNELSLLLLGANEYQYFDRWVGHADNTNLPELLSSLYGFISDEGREIIRDRLLLAINEIIESYEGLFPVATCILFESSHRSENQPTLGLPLDELAEVLRQKVREFGFKLEKDKTGPGFNWPRGRLDDMRRLSKNTVRLGGPSFTDQ